ncbi:MAG: prolipoprotein diacylglyceryl transferase, partial [Proteobacteria bacterium]|nr:prolipoprotein diacylglyceryl transferase [Pseudomonadota bacterium]
MAISIEPISPIAFSLGGIEIRWYALAYIAGFVFGFWLLKKLYVGAHNCAPSPQSGDYDGREYAPLQSKKSWDDLMAAVILGVIIGGRLGYVLFYNLPFFLANPLEIFMVWHGGMSFHGGLLGVIAAVFLFAKRTEKLRQSLEF